VVIFVIIRSEPLLDGERYFVPAGAVVVDEDNEDFRNCAISELQPFMLV